MPGLWQRHGVERISLPRQLKIATCCVFASAQLKNSDWQQPDFICCCSFLPVYNATDPFKRHTDGAGLASQGP